MAMETRVFEKFDTGIMVGFDSYIMGTLATRLIGTNPRSEEDVERSISSLRRTISHHGGEV